MSHVMLSIGRSRRTVAAAYATTFRWRTPTRTRARYGWPTGPMKFIATRLQKLSWARQEVTDDRPLHVAHTERPQDPHHARGVCAAVQRARYRYRRGRSVQAGVSED